MEKNYDFHKYLQQQIHPMSRRDPDVRPNPNETEITEAWSIVIPQDAAPLFHRAAEDLQKHFKLSMGLSLPLTILKDSLPRQCIAFLPPEILPAAALPRSQVRGGFHYQCTADTLRITPNDDRGAFRAAVYLEDLMNLREAPLFPQGAWQRDPLLRMQSVHSNCELDEYPDWELDAIAHAGYTAIEIFVRDIDETTRGKADIGDIVRRAASYGLDTVLYNYVHCYKHPDDPDAEEVFDKVYGTLARKYPEARAISFVGESLEFPSKDPATTGKRWFESVVDSIPDTRPSPGWYPCQDYPAYVRAIHRAIRKVNPNLEIIFNTYNWCWADLDARRKFLESIPKDVTIQATYEILRQTSLEDRHFCIMDYSISAKDPGFYFTSELEAAHRQGLQLRATTNTSGSTWDFGTLPYVPVPYRWLHRLNVLRKYRREYGLDSFYECHHYGWWPNPLQDLEKAMFHTPECADPEKLLRDIAVRDYGEAAADLVLNTWKLWSDALDFYHANNEDQYGPWRTGPSYPFIFQPNITRTMSAKEIDFPADPKAWFGGKIIKTLYQPYENAQQSPAPLRYPVELQELDKMLGKMNVGISSLKQALEKMPAHKKANGEKLLGMGMFMRNSAITTRNIKQWWLLNMALQTSRTRQEMLDTLDKIETLARDEIQNAKETIPWVEADSRLGFEPSMHYVCDAWHLDWKIRQVESALREIATYRDIIRLA